MQRSQKAISLIYLACSFLAWLLFRELVTTVWLAVRLPIPSDWVVAPPELIAAAGAVAVFVVMMKNEKINTFVNEVITELSKVVRPNRKETVLSTGVVSVLVGICAMILFTFDMVWGTLVKIFYR